MDKATELAKIIAWARANGVTPELRVKTTTTTSEGYGPSPDEKGLRGSAWHRCLVEALVPGPVWAEVLARVPSKEGNEDAYFDDAALRREVLAPVYKALTGAELPAGPAAGSEKFLAEGRANVGQGAGNESAWEVWRVDGEDGWYVEARWTYPGSPLGETWYRRRLVRDSFRPSRKVPGGHYVPDGKSPLLTLTAEQAAEVFEELRTYVVEGGAS